MNGMDVDAVIVDLDGTMVDTLGDFAMKRSTACCADLSLPPIAAEARSRTWWARARSTCVQC
jgi:phosphoglycolate phosphatase